MIPEKTRGDKCLNVSLIQKIVKIFSDAEVVSKMRGIFADFRKRERK